MNENIKISVLLPVYNGEKYLDESIDSILNQTYTNYEFIIINDGSKDNSESICLKYNDKRIRYYSQSNLGLSATLNKAINLASGKFIARQDQDDISLPERFKRQVDFLNTNPDYAMVGTWARIFSEKEKIERYHKHPTKNADILREMIFDNPFVHSSMMIRKSVLVEIGGYTTDIKRQPPEDYELWSRIIKKYKVANIPEVLLNYREVLSSMSRNNANPFSENVFLVSMENIAFFSSVSVDDPAVVALSMLTHDVLQDKKMLVPYRMIKKILLKLKHTFIPLTDDVKKFSKEWDLINQRVLNNYISLKYDGKIAKLLFFFLKLVKRFLNILWLKNYNG